MWPFVAILDSDSSGAAPSCSHRRDETPPRLDQFGLPQGKVLIHLGISSSRNYMFTYKCICVCARMRVCVYVCVHTCMFAVSVYLFFLSLLFSLFFLLLYPSGFQQVGSSLFLLVLLKVSSCEKGGVFLPLCSPGAPGSGFLLL